MNTFIEILRSDGTIQGYVPVDVIELLLFDEAKGCPMVTLRGFDMPAIVSNRTYAYLLEEYVRP